MDVDTRLLRYFAAVADEGHLTRAARRLFVSQPALTKAMRQLENLLGIQLFVRSRTGMTLTAAGRTLADNVPALLSDWDRVLRETKGSAGQAARVLTLGFVASAANEATPEIIAAFVRRRPGWRVDMRQTGWTDPSAGLADGVVDAALVRLPGRLPRGGLVHRAPLGRTPRNPSAGDKGPDRHTGFARSAVCGPCRTGRVAGLLDGCRRTAETTWHASGPLRPILKNG